MKLVIDMPEEIYDDIQSMDWKNSIWANDILRAIHNGMPLPKGHGRLIDADSFLEKYDTLGYIEDMQVDYFNAVTPTIMEGDK